MATQAYLALSTFLNILKETIHLQIYSEHDSKSLLNRVLRMLLQAVAELGKTLPHELRWCDNQPTIEALEASIPTENQSSREPRAQDDPLATEDISGAKSSSPDDAAQDNASAAHDARDNNNRAKDDNNIAQDDNNIAQDDNNIAQDDDNIAQDDDDIAQDDDDIAQDDDDIAQDDDDIAQDDDDIAQDDDDIAQDDASTTQDTSSAKSPPPDGIAQNDTYCTTEDMPMAKSPLPDNIAQDNTSAAQDTSNVERCLTPDDIVQDDTYTAEDIPRAESSSPDDIAQDDALPIQNPLKNPLSIVDAMVEELMAEAPNFKKWTKDPADFWKQSEQTLQLPNTTPNDRINKYISHAAEAESNDMVQNFGRKGDSVVIYHDFKHQYPLVKKLKPCYVQEFGKDVGYSLKGDQEKLQTILVRGRRRAEFCHRLSEDGIKSSKFWSDMDFKGSNYGALFLRVDERIWLQQSKYRTMYEDTLDKLRSSNKILEALEESGATFAAESILQYRWSSVQGLLAPVNCQESNNMMGSSTVAGMAEALQPSAWSLIQEPSSLFNYHESNDTAASNQPCQSMIQAPSAPSKRSSAEAGFDDLVASKRLRARNLDILSQVALSEQNPTAFETSSVLHSMQLNSTLPPTPQFDHFDAAFASGPHYTPNVASYTQNSVDVPDGSPSDGIGDVNNQHPQGYEADLDLNNWPTSTIWNQNSVDVPDGSPSGGTNDVNNQPQEEYEAYLDLNNWPTSTIWHSGVGDIGL